MTNDNYSQITWPEVRKGDLLMHENGDRLTVFDRNSIGDVYVSGVWRDGAVLRRHGFTPHRRKPEVPTVPGAHLDKDGDVWVREDNDTDNPWRYGRNGFLYSDQDAAEFAPFTRLVPMPTEEEVATTLTDSLPKIDSVARWVSKQTPAVMALLGGGDDD